jgi:hypothetical protein
MKTTIHLDLSPFSETYEDFRLLNSTKYYDIVAHTDASRAELKRKSLFYSFIPDEQITHYAVFNAPSDGSVSLTQVTVTEQLDGFTIHPAISMAITIPKVSFEKMMPYHDEDHTDLAREFLQNRLGHLEDFSLPESIEIDEDKLIALHMDGISYMDSKSTAAAYLFQHVSLTQLDGNQFSAAYVYTNIILKTNLNAPTIQILIANNPSWRIPTASKDKSGNPITDPSDSSQLIYTLKIVPSVMKPLTDAVGAAVLLSRQDEKLKQVLWTTQFGVMSSSYNAQVVDADAAPRLRGSENWQLSNISSRRGFSLSVGDYDAAKKILNVNATNHWLRHMSVYVGFHDVFNKPINLDDAQLKKYGLTNTLGYSDALSFLEDPNYRRHFMNLGPVNSTCGIPLPTDPTVMPVPIIDEAAYVQLYFGTLGFNGDYDGDITPSGMILTGAFELILPPILLALGDAVTKIPIVKNLLNDKEFIYAMLIMCSPELIGYLASDPVGFLKTFGGVIGKFLVSMIGKICEKIGGKAAAVAPIVGGAADMFAAIATAAAMAETLVEAAQSPGYYKVDISRTIDLTVTLNPDPKFHKFPDLAASFEVFIRYKVEATSPAFTKKVKISKTTVSKPITVTFENIPQVSSIQAWAGFYADNDWQAGQGKSDWVDTSTAVDGQLKTSLDVHTNIVPLTIDTKYLFKQKLVLKNGERIWDASSDAPYETRTYQYPDKDHYIFSFNGISIGQYAEVLGYSWEASGLNMPPDDPQKSRSMDQLNMVQTISVLQSPQASYAIPNVAYRNSSNIALCISGKEGASQQNFYLDPSGGPYDPSNPKSGVHLRGFTATHNEKPDLIEAEDESWGRFLTPVDALVVHPQGLVIGVNSANHKLQILTIPKASSSSSKAPKASYSSGYGGRIGLLNTPVGVGVDGVGHIFVLEAGNNRVQVFDTNGNPVKLFGSGQEKTASFSLKDTPGSVHYLDMAVETKGYVFVLHYSGHGYSSDDYRVDIYQPNGVYLTGTSGIAAAKITVDILRNLFTLNYELMSGTASPTEPSVSQWTPTPPNP